MLMIHVKKLRARYHGIEALGPMFIAFVAVVLIHTVYKNALSALPRSMVIHTVQLSCIFIPYTCNVSLLYVIHCETRIRYLRSLEYRS